MKLAKYFHVSIMAQNKENILKYYDDIVFSKNNSKCPTITHGTDLTGLTLQPVTSQRPVCRGVRGRLARKEIAGGKRQQREAVFTGHKVSENWSVIGIVWF